MSAEDSHGCVRIVVFDMGGVLTNDVVEPLRDHLIKTFSLSPERADQLRSFCKQHWNQMKVNPDPVEEMLSAFPEFSSLSVEDLKRLLRQKMSERSFPEVIRVAERVRAWGSQRSLLMGILSNHTNEWFAELLERFQLRNIFTDPRLVISSHEVRCAKPDPAVYEVLLSRCRQALPDVRADQVLFIDDKLENVEAARAMGIRAIQYNSRTTPAEQLARALAAELRCDPQELLP